MDEAKKLLAKAKNDYHGILGVKKNASMDDIKKAYHEKAKLHHPGIFFSLLQLLSIIIINI